MTPVTGKTASSPTSMLPPLKMSPGPPATPGNASVLPGPLERISVPASSRNESPGKVFTPTTGSPLPTAGLRSRVGLPPVTATYLFPATGEDTVVLGGLLQTASDQ